MFRWWSLWHDQISVVLGNLLHCFILSHLQGIPIFLNGHISQQHGVSAHDDRTNGFMHNIQSGHTHLTSLTGHWHKGSIAFNVCSGLVDGVDMSVDVLVLDLQLTSLISQVLMESLDQDDAVLIVLIVQGQRALNHVCTSFNLQKAGDIDVYVMKEGLVSESSQLHIVGVEEQTSCQVRSEGTVELVVLEILTHDLLSDAVVHVTQPPLVKSFINVTLVVIVDSKLLMCNLCHRGTTVSRLIPSLLKHININGPILFKCLLQARGNAVQNCGEGECKEGQFLMIEHVEPQLVTLTWGLSLMLKSEIGVTCDLDLLNVMSVSIKEKQAFLHDLITQSLSLQLMYTDQQLGVSETDVMSCLNDLHKDAEQLSDIHSLSLGIQLLLELR